MNNNITLINVGRLIPHPQNPRKNLGDLTELAESIKANGVYQNLTVVPRDDEKYTIVIGHRRHAAAKLAGIDKLPCVIVEMTMRQQYETMLLENMQRTDLTVIEEAQGFQLLIDLGDSVADIATETGFSKAKIKSRINLNQYDPTAVEKAFQHGATLEDYMKLSKIKNDKRRKEIEKKIGTPSFGYAITSALKEERWEAEKPLVEELLESSGAKKTEEYLSVSEYIRRVDTDSAKKVKEALAESAEGREIRYRFTNWCSGVIIYFMKTSEEIDKTKDEARAYGGSYEERRVIDEHVSELIGSLDGYINGFIADFDEKAYLASCKDRDNTFVHIVKILISDICRILTETASDIDTDFVREVFGLKFKDLVTELEEEQFFDVGYQIDLESGNFEKLATKPIRLLLAVYRSAISLHDCYNFNVYSRDHETPQHVRTAHPAQLIRQLEVFGFQTPDELTQFIDGTHQIYTKEFCKKLIEDHRARRAESE